jgi:hypothetical protein
VGDRHDGLTVVESGTKRSVVAQIASVVRRSRVQQLRRSQQTADVIGVQRHVSPSVRRRSPATLCVST